MAGSRKAALKAWKTMRKTKKAKITKLRKTALKAWRTRRHRGN